MILTAADLATLTARTRPQAQGVDATALLGHSDARTTQTYLRDRSAVLVRGPRKVG